MSRDEMVEGLGTIARSGTKAFVDRIEAGKAERGQTSSVSLAWESTSNATSSWSTTATAPPSNVMKLDCGTPYFALPA
jgi:hypothetical protein